MEQRNTALGFPGSPHRGSYVSEEMSCLDQKTYPCPWYLSDMEEDGEGAGGV